MTATPAGESADRVFADTICQNCREPLQTEYIRLGLPVRCWHCGIMTVPRVPEGGHYPVSGKQLTYTDFISLVYESATGAYGQEVGELIRKWFGYELVVDGEDIFARNAAGDRIAPLALHLKIQADHEMSSTLYNAAMTLWH